MHERCEHCSRQGKRRRRAAKSKKQIQKRSPRDSATPAPELLTRGEAAKFLGIAEQTLAVWKTSARYSLPVIKVGRLVRYRRTDLEAFLEQNTWTAKKKREAKDGN